MGGLHRKAMKLLKKAFVDGTDFKLAFNETFVDKSAAKSPLKFIAVRTVQVRTCLLELLGQQM
jgi:hypothetical protein